MITAQSQQQSRRLGLAVALALVVLWQAAALANGRLPGPLPRTPAPWRPPLVRVAPLPPPPAVHMPEAHVIVLMYHLVGPLQPKADREEKALTVSAERFETDLRELRAAGCHCVTMAQAYDLMRRGRLPRHAVVLTFDDGYEDNYTVAWPLMRKYGYVGTFNLVYDSLSLPGHMNRAQARQLAADGNEIGSHTVSHSDLTSLDSAHVRMEVTESKQKLEALLGEPVITFCYPEGRRNRHVVQAVRDAGYWLATTVTHGAWTANTPLLEIPRYRMAEHTDLLKSLDGWLSPQRVTTHTRGR